MKLITIDMETYYGDDYTLSKMTTESYIRDPRFEPLLVGVKVDDGPLMHATGAGHMQTLLDCLDIENNAVLCHHAHFDGLILSHHFGHKPKVWFDTLSMARALHGAEVGNSLSKLMKHYEVGEKGFEVSLAKGKRFADFTPVELKQYAVYCMNDVQGTYDIFQKMLPSFDKLELQIIDMIIRMFTEPALLLNEEQLRDYALDIQAEKATLLLEAKIQLSEVMSNDKFALALQNIGIDPPRKLSPTTGKPAWAFAKTDKAFTDLEEHDLPEVQALVAARLGNKTTINEKRALRMADMAPRGVAPIYLKYSGAEQTHRLSGGDSMNWQNMQRGGRLRDSIYAPPGTEIAADSSLIEARINDWLSMQEDWLEVYRNYDAGLGPDVYCMMASALYGMEITKETHPQERQVGKYIKLSCGYQSGPPRLQETIRIESRKAGHPITVTNDQSRRMVDVYRQRHAMVELLWQRAQSAIPVIAAGPESTSGIKYLDSRHIMRIEQGVLIGPTGLRIRYPELSWDKKTKEWTYKARDGLTNLYGGKVVQHVCELLARTAVLEQTLKIHQHTPCRLSVHDEGVFLVPEGEGAQWLQYALGVMSIPPKWAPDLPVAASGGYGKIYGAAKAS